MRICVIGAGAIGGYCGFQLQSAGHEVVYLVRPNTQKVLESKGMTLVDTESKHHHLQVQSVTEVDDLEPFDLTIVAVKSFTNESVLPAIQTLAEKGSYIFSVQNGVTNEAFFAASIPAEQIIPAAAYISADSPERGVIHPGGISQFIIGSLVSDKNQDFVAQLETALTEAGIKCRSNQNIMQIKWNKLCWNIAFNPLTALTEAMVGDVFVNDNLFSTVKNVIAEYRQVAESEGYPVPDKIVNKILEDNRVPNHKTSMLQDRDKGNVMEVDVIIGDIIDIARKHDIPVPVMETIYNALSYINEKLK